jgi:pSer/pThr/pTyr-binding forkhead associated (FHA) protein
MPTLLIRHPDGSESEQELAGELTVGRAEGNDIMLAEGGVSRKHARLYLEAGQVFVEDTGSANGTFVDGLKIEQPTELAVRGQLVIGDYEISLKQPGQKPRPAAAKPAPPRNNDAGGGPPLDRPTVARPAVKAARSTRVVPPLKPGERPSKDKVNGEPSALAKRGERAKGTPAASGPALRGLTGPWANKVFSIRGKVTVGRVAGVQVQIEDDSVSRRHAEVEATAGGLVLRDLGSANGTLVNGSPAEGEVGLRPGDIVQFGVVELVVDGAQEAGGPARRRGLSGAAPGASAGRNKRLLFIGGGIAGVVVLLLGVKVAVGGHSEPPPQAAAPTPEGDLQELLSQCRSYSDCTTGDPDWRRAEVACEKALDLEPINPEANQLIKKIKLEKGAVLHFEQGQKLLRRLKEDEAIDEFSKIIRESCYYAKVKTQIQDVAEAAKKRAADECKRYANNGFWNEAAERCARYMFFACQSMSTADLQAPPGFATKCPARAKKKEWCPADQNFQRLIAALAHDPNAKQWQCEHSDILVINAPPPSPEEDVRKALQARFPETGIWQALFSYWHGDSGGAVVGLSKILEDTEKATLHDTAKQLKKQIFDAAGVYKDGETALQRDEVEEAAKYFDEANQIDKDLMKDLSERHPSFFRRSINNDISAKAFERGKFYGDRDDKRRACKLIKIGFGFFKGNTELNKAAAVCSTLASRALEAAADCQALDKVLDFAVDGDGIAERVADKKAELKCPATTGPRP